MLSIGSSADNLHALSRIKGFAVSDMGVPKHMLSDYRMGKPYNGM